MKKKKDEKWKKWANVAPDGTIVLYSKKHNLYWMDKENFLKAVADEKDSTIVENQWTKDGVEHLDMEDTIEEWITRILKK